MDLHIIRLKTKIFPQVKLCARPLRSKITPETAIDILHLADRHGLAQLKQVSAKKFYLKQRQTSLFFGYNFFFFFNSTFVLRMWWQRSSLRRQITWKTLSSRKKWQKTCWWKSLHSNLFDFFEVFDFNHKMKTNKFQAFWWTDFFEDGGGAHLKWSVFVLVLSIVLCNIALTCTFYLSFFGTPSNFLCIMQHCLNLPFICHFWDTIYFFWPLKVHQKFEYIK